MALRPCRWSIGRRIVEQEQHGQARADHGAALVDRLAIDLAARFGRGFGRRNLFKMRAFFLAYREMVQTPSAQSRGLPAATIVRAASALSGPMTRADGPKERTLVAEIERTIQQFEARRRTLRTRRPKE